MTHYGRFETVEELYRGPLGQVVRAHLVGDVEADEFAIKFFDPSRMGLLEADAATQTFLDRAGLQKFLADRGLHHWAPIYEMKAIPEGAYYVTDFYPLTAQQLLDAKVTVTAADLHWLISSVVRGLLELKQGRKRAHANLKPSNILISGREGIRESQIFLSDPASNGKGSDDRVSDMRAIGKLIHQLVLGAAYTGERDWPIADGPQWSRLGREGKGWRDLCRQLLDPSARPEDVEALGRALELLVPRATPRKRHRLVLAVIPVLLVAGFFGLLAHSNYVASEQLTAIDHAWFGKFARAMEDPARRERFRADPDLKPIVEELEQNEARHLPLNSKPAMGFRLDGAEKARQMFAGIKRIEADLSSDHWKKLSDAFSLEQRYEQRHWVEPAEYLRDLTANVAPSEGIDVAAGVDRLLRVSPRLFSDAETADTLWTHFDTDLQSAEQTRDKTLALFAQSLRRAVTGQLHLDDNGFSGLDELRADAPLAQRLAEVGRSGWPADYGRDRLAKEVEYRLNMIDPTPPDVRQWAQSVQGYRLAKLDQSSQVIALLNQSFAKAREEIDRQALPPIERAAAERSATDVQGKLRALTETRYLSRDILNNSGELAAHRDAIQHDIDALRKEWVKLDDPGEWLTFVDQPLPLTSEKLKQRWKSWVELQRSHQPLLASNHEVFLAAKSGAEAVRSALTTLDQKFPQVPTGMNERFAALAWDRREQALSDLSKWAMPGEASPQTGPSTLPLVLPTTGPNGYVTGVPMPPADLGMEEQASRFADWVGKLHDLNADFPVTRELLSLGDRPDQKWKTRDSDFWNDPSVQTLVRSDLSRLANLQAIGDATREQLITIASTSTSPEIVLAAWKRLGFGAEEHNPGVSPISPPWPTQKGELEMELAIRGRVESLLKSLKNSSEAAAPLALLRDEGPIRWRRYTETCNPELLPSSARLAQSFGVDDAQLNKLSFNAHFDYELYLANGAAAGSRDEQANAIADGLRRSAGNLKDSPEILDLIARLEHLGDREPMSDPKLLDQKPGDGYRLSIKDSPYAIQFVRVQAPGVRPFYLATTETSIGMFIDTVSAANAWSSMNPLLKSPVPLRGPQAWARAASPDSPISRYVTWRYNDGRNPAQEFDFAPSLRQARFNRHTLATDLGGNPQEEHPMQQVPAQAAMYAAALLNCRLPTAREWRSAYDLFEAKTSIQQWNLRDQTFRMQLDYHAPDAAGQWPDNEVSGTYWPKDRLRPGQPNCRDTDDGTLFFRKVDAPGGSTFLNLVGNVAEFVCNAPEAFDGMPNRRSADAIAAYAAASARSVARDGHEISHRQLFVIGGSALSDPTLDPVKPYPVTSAAEPFADVGFRLAFSAPLATVAERLHWAIVDQPYLPPAGATTTNASAR